MVAVFVVCLACSLAEGESLLWTVGLCKPLVKGKDIRDDTELKGTMVVTAMLLPTRLPLL